MRKVLSLAALLAWAGCASSGGGGQASQSSEIALPGGGSLSFSDGGFEAMGWGEYDDPAAAIKDLSARLKSLKGDDAPSAEQRCVTLSMLANAHYAQYEKTKDRAALQASIDVGKQTLAEVERVQGAGIVTGISMPLINAKTSQEDAVAERQAKLTGK